jgi:hypothetical protein
MSTRDNEINRDIDTAEGHIRHPFGEEGEKAGNAGDRTTIRRPEDALDDEAEGHIVRYVDDAGDAGIRLS